MNFVEAALLIQGSACVYSKKVGVPDPGLGVSVSSRTEVLCAAGASGRLTPPLTCLVSPSLPLSPLLATF